MLKSPKNIPMTVRDILLDVYSASGWDIVLRSVDKLKFLEELLCINILPFVDPVGEACKEHRDANKIYKMPYFKRISRIDCIHTGKSEGTDVAQIRSSFSELRNSEYKIEY